MSDKGIQETAEEAVHFLEQLARPIGKAITHALPIIITTTRKVYGWYCTLPQNAIHFIIGCVFCFFGGLYPVLFAAIAAAEHAGRATLLNALSDLSNEAMIIIEASKKDDDVDNDKDGVSDVDEISGMDYLVRKTRLVLQKMNPNKVDTAISSMYKVWLSVAAVLSVKFAKTISLALSISDFIRKPCDRFLSPLLQLAIPDEYDKWVPVVLGWICKSFAMSIAWKIQEVLSAFSSALTGGLMMANAFYHFLLHRNITFGGHIHADETKNWFLDIFSMIFAASGFYFQFSLGFDMPSPFNYILWPFELAEYYLRWSITKAS